MQFTCSHGSFIQKTIELRLLVSRISKLWEENYGCAKKYRRDLDIYLMNVLSYLYGIIMDLKINALGHGNNVFDGILLLKRAT